MPSFRYSTFDDKPYIMMVVETNGYKILYPMLLDTGADRTIFPDSFAAFVGHNNKNPRVVRKNVSGIGGKTTAYIHTMHLSLVDPSKPFKVMKGIKAPSCVWQSSLTSFHFVKGFACQFGLLGRDLIREWKEVALSSTGSRWNIDVTI